MGRSAIITWAAAGCLIAASTAFAAPFAMITDLQGNAWAMEAGQPKKLSLLGYIEGRTEMKVDPAAKVAVTYFASGMQYNFAGPSRVSLEAAAPKVIDGRAAEFRKVTPEKAIEGGGLSTDQWRRLQQATVVMRAVKSSFAVVGPDKTALLALHPEFEWRGPREFPDLAEPHYGHAGVRRYLAKLSEVFNDYRMAAEQFIDVGDDRVLVLAREGGRGTGSGIEVQSNPTGHVWTIRDGRPARLQSWQRIPGLRSSPQTVPCEGRWIMWFKRLMQTSRRAMAGTAPGSGWPLWTAEFRHILT